MRAGPSALFSAAAALTAAMSPTPPRPPGVGGMAPSSSPSVPASAAAAAAPPPPLAAAATSWFLRPSLFITSVFFQRGAAVVPTASLRAGHRSETLSRRSVRFERSSAFSASTRLIKSGLDSIVCSSAQSASSPGALTLTFLPSAALSSTCTSSSARRTSCGGRASLRTSPSSRSETELTAASAASSLTISAGLSNVGGSSSPVPAPEPPYLRTPSRAAATSVRASAVWPCSFFLSSVAPLMEADVLLAASAASLSFSSATLQEMIAVSIFSLVVFSFSTATSTAASSRSTSWNRASTSAFFRSAAICIVSREERR